MAFPLTIMFHKTLAKKTFKNTFFRCTHFLVFSEFKWELFFFVCLKSWTLISNYTLYFTSTILPSMASSAWPPAVAIFQNFWIEIFLNPYQGRWRMQSFMILGQEVTELCVRTDRQNDI